MLRSFSVFNAKKFVGFCRHLRCTTKWCSECQRRIVQQRSIHFSVFRFRSSQNGSPLRPAPAVVTALLFPSCRSHNCRLTDSLFVPFSASRVLNISSNLSDMNMYEGCTVHGEGRDSLRMRHLADLNGCTLVISYHDYTQHRTYFVTIPCTSLKISCTRRRQCLFCCILVLQASWIVIVSIVLCVPLSHRLQANYAARCGHSVTFRGPFGLFLE